MTYNTSNTIMRIALGSAFGVAVFAAVLVMPPQAHACIKALGFLDPLCVATGESDLPGFSGGLPALPSLPGISNNDAPQTVNNTYNNTNSNNVNSNINSPGAVVGAPIAYNTTPVYNYSYPVYNNYPNNNQGPLQVSCYPMPLTADEGESVTWYASAYGGNGSYYYSWSGTDGLTGYGQSIARRYYNDGYKNATVTVTSGGQTVSRNCDGSVRVRDNGYYYDNNNYYYNNGSYSSLSVWCSADTTGSSVGTYVRWNANVSGGNGYYTYEWSGTDGIYGSGQSISYMYRSPGQKYASVTVRSDGRVVTQNCSNSVTIGGYYGTSNSDNNNGLDVACYADPATARVNQPITWRAEVVGGSAPYTYSWSGSNDLSGSDISIIKYYGTTGGKNAIVTVTSADGRKATRACSNEATIRSSSATNTSSQSSGNTDSSSDTNPLTAAALFSLKNVPWGWVAVLVILVLFGTVMYLLFNRKDI